MVRINALILIPSVILTAAQRHVTLDLGGRQVILNIAESTPCEGSKTYFFDPVIQEGACCETGEEFRCVTLSTIPRSQSEISSNGICQPATMTSPLYMPSDTCNGGCGCPSCPACPSFPAIPACPACPCPGSGTGPSPPVVPPMAPACPAMDLQTYVSNNVTFQIFCGKSVGGADLIPSFPAKDLQGCIDSCAARVACQGEDYYQGQCYLKSNYVATPTITNAACIAVLALPKR